MKRLFLLLLIVIPYWLGLHRVPGSPHLSPGSLWPFVYGFLSLALFLPAGWWLFKLDDDDRRATFSRIGLGSLGGIALVYLIGFAMSNPALVAKFLGAPAGLAFGALGFGNVVKDFGALPLWVSIVGYTLGVGLTEEASKAVAARSDVLDGVWPRAAFGFAAGIGFGVGEALLYSYRDYAGTADWPAYATRFLFCVGFHGCMSAIAILSLPEDWWDFDQWPTTALRLLPIAFLHGAYDALLVRQHPVWAGIVAMVTILALPILIWCQEDMAGEV